MHARSNETGSIPLHRVAVLRPFVQFLAEAGAPVERLVQRSGIPYRAIDDLNNYVPSHRFWAFLVTAARSEGIPDLGFLVGSRYGADSSDPKLSKLLQRSPTFHHALTTFCELNNKTISHCNTGVVRGPDGDHARIYHSPSCDRENPAITQIGWFGLTAVIGTIRIFTGPEWQPREIGVMTNRAPCDAICEEFPNTRIRLGQKYSYVELENSLLSLPPLTEKTDTLGPSDFNYRSFSDGLVGSLRQVLMTYFHEPKLSIELAAALCQTSKRSLQRRLAESGTCYSKVLDHTRYDVASRMLQEPDTTVTDVARLLGYSDPTHFARAFRRIAGVSPRAYRKTHMARTGTG
jgi:AraC-like DNA-binding protein